MAKIAIMGHGVVGSGVAELLWNNRETVEKNALEPVSVKRILDLRSFPELPYADQFTTDVNDILQDNEITIVAEAMGGVNPAYEFVSECLKRGKSVVTSNKELVAQKGAELLALAAKENVNFLFEASVGGGIPIIHPLHKCLTANRINGIMGILNGTTNFILTSMYQKGMSFDDALKMAQELGYAEREPSADVDGHDTCRKICILASLAYGKHIYPQYVHTEGIRHVTPEDIAYAESWGGTVKLIGSVKPLPNGKLALMVCPMLLPNSCPLAPISDVFNGVLVKGDATGDVMFYGRGAGKLPTASAMVGDIIDAVKHHATIPTLHWAECGENPTEPFEDIPAAFYFRVNTRGQLPREVRGFELLKRDHAPDDEKAFITRVMPDSEAKRLSAALEDAGVAVCSRIRLADFGD